MTFNEITQPVEKHLTEFNGFFENLMHSDVSLLNLILKYISSKRGKQIRPALVFLSAEIAGGVNHRSFVGAGMVELLHTATLIHDDVVDQSDKRRGIASVNADWNNKIAVLIGDFLLGKGLLSAIDGDEFDFLRATSRAVRRMSEGELLQIQKSREFGIDEGTYFRIISDKTASLLSSCSEIGAISASGDTGVQNLLAEYGEMIGIAFQIRDDIFDYLPKNFIIGKPVGNDLKEKKLTLPLIHSISKVSKKEAREVIKLIKNGELTKKNVVSILDFVNSHGGIEYASKKAEYYSNLAIDKLNIFPDSAAKQSLINLAKFVLERKS